MALNARVLLVPHFAAMLLESRLKQESRLQETLRSRGEAYRSEGARVVVMPSAGWNEEGPFQVDSGSRLKTLQDFDGLDVDLRYTCEGWRELAEALHENGLANGLPVEQVHRGMDSGVSVPLSYMFPDGDRRVVPLSVSPRSREDYQAWGAVVRETCRGVGAGCAILVGGSISFDPAAYGQGYDRREGSELDRQVLSRLEAGQWDELAALPGETLSRGSAHASLLHLRFLEGLLGGPVKGRVLAYHRHPGVGSAVVEFELLDA